MSDFNHADKHGITRAPQVVMHNGMEFITTVEAAKRLGVSIRSIANYARQGKLKPYRIPGLGGNGIGRPTYYFKADQVRGLMP